MLHHVENVHVVVSGVQGHLRENLNSKDIEADNGQALGSSDCSCFVHLA